MKEKALKYFADICREIEEQGLKKNEKVITTKQGDSKAPIVSIGIQQPPSIPAKLINTEQIPGADLSLKIVPNKIPKNILVISIGN